MPRHVSILLTALVAVSLAASDAATTVPKDQIKRARVVRRASTDQMTIPGLLSYQGKLLDDTGSPVPDSTWPVLFALCAESVGGTPFWIENQLVETSDGLFHVLLGQELPIPSVPESGDLFLGMKVGADPEMTPRVRIVSAAYAFLAGRADTANYALAGGGGGGDNAWTRVGSDSVLYTVHSLGIARGGAGNVLYGESTHTHVNLGVACTTGTSGQNYFYATVGGGHYNAATGWTATVGGGESNDATGWTATVGGGYRNDAAGSAATVSGGRRNDATGSAATVGGGYYNTASGLGATVPGGYYSAARGNYSFAAGRYARANHYASLVWSDSAHGASDSVYTTGSNQFRVRARGGTWFYSNGAMTTGAYLAANSNSWQSVCDSTTKEDFKDVDRQELLAKVADLRVRDYKMKDQHDGTRHIGPVAQDFYSAFGYGETNTGINLADADGVLLAAVQALYEWNQAQQAEIEALKAELNRR
jgi:hypothetical protein